MPNPLPNSPTIPRLHEREFMLFSFNIYKACAANAPSSKLLACICYPMSTLWFSLDALKPNVAHEIVIVNCECMK